MTKPDNEGEMNETEYDYVFEPLRLVSDRCQARQCQGLQCTKRNGHLGDHNVLRPTSKNGWGVDEPQERLVVASEEKWRGLKAACCMVDVDSQGNEHGSDILIKCETLLSGKEGVIFDPFGHGMTARIGDDGKWKYGIGEPFDDEKLLTVCDITARLFQTIEGTQANLFFDVGEAWEYFDETVMRIELYGHSRITPSNWTIITTESNLKKLDPIKHLVKEVIGK